jgi:uncharacterized OsmC-like protein
MAITSKVSYQGELRTEATHIKSNNSIITDAPVDNNGKGNAFSPTDLVATALANCMLTVMGIKARAMNFDLEDATAEVEKVMDSSPRRIGEVKVRIQLKKNCDEHTQKVLEKTAFSCPVAKSLGADVKQTISFVWI